MRGARVRGQGWRLRCDCGRDSCVMLRGREELARCGGDTPDENRQSMIRYWPMAASAWAAMSRTNSSLSCMRVSFRAGHGFFGRRSQAPQGNRRLQADPRLRVGQSPISTGTDCARLGTLRIDLRQRPGRSQGHGRVLVLELLLQRGLGRHRRRSHLAQGIAGAVAHLVFRIPQGLGGRRTQPPPRRDRCRRGPTRPRTGRERPCPCSTISAKAGAASFAAGPMRPRIDAAGGRTFSCFKGVDQCRHRRRTQRLQRLQGVAQTLLVGRTRAPA